MAKKKKTKHMTVCSDAVEVIQFEDKYIGEMNLVIQEIVSAEVEERKRELQS